MYDICVFAGTTEGRKLVEFLHTQPLRVTACVATDYGGSLLPSPDEDLKISAKRLPVGEIVALLEKEGFDLVIDATHPYAQSITGSIASACQSTGTRYLRLLRAPSETKEKVVTVADAEDAADFLAGTEGNILLTTGSKDLGSFSKLPNFAQRVYARVLPMEASLEACRKAGLKPDHIIAMQGPFSLEMDMATLSFASARWLVTKDGGIPGGFAEKAEAARMSGAGMVLLGRPPQREGLSYAETIELLCSHFGCRRCPEVSIIGIGPGSEEWLCPKAQSAIKQADCIIGAKRMLELLPSCKPKREAVAAETIAQMILRPGEHQRFAVLMSGDTGFYSGAKKLSQLLEGCHVELLPGISSLSYFCARLHISYEDIRQVSLHGRDHDPIADIRSNERCFFLMGGDQTVQSLCRRMIESGMGELELAVGERLSYPDEKISRGTAAELCEGSFEALAVVLVENPCPNMTVTHGLPDELFLRGGGERIVPMTKSEPRSVALSKLALTERAVCWDIGAGTGSVAIEMARQASKGSVYAVEQRSDALELLNENKKRFSAENLHIVAGRAPQACRDLPAPTHVFIGGSSGGMKEILSFVLEISPNARIVATAVTLDTIACLSACVKELPLKSWELVSMQVARARRAGSYDLMQGQDPVYIFTMQGGGLS